MWSCGGTRKIKAGDTFFLMKVGVEPKGIIACGYVVSEPYLHEHWDKEKAASGKEALRTDLLFQSISETPIVPLSTLQADHPHYKWTPQGGGITVPDEIAIPLFNFIQSHPNFNFVRKSLADVVKYAEGKRKKITTTSYDRSVLARQDCIEHHGYECAVCGFSFEKAYGAIGAKYIEVHHLQQLADAGGEYEIDPVKDLRPVCANCHRMLHKRRPPLSIEELKSCRVATMSK